MSEHTNDPAAMQTAAGFPLIDDIPTTFVFSLAERRLLRELASRTAEIAAGETERRRAELWTLHNDLEGERPMVFIDPENGWNEIIPPSELQCRDPLARVWEMYFRKQIFWAESLRDDKVIEDFFDVPWCYRDTGWGVELRKHGGEGSGAYKVDPAINDYDLDLPKIKSPEIVIDDIASERMMELALELFGDILKVRRKSIWWWTLGMTWDYINLRGLDNLMMDLVLQPDKVHRTMAMLRDGYHARLDFLEAGGFLSSNSGGSYVGSGGFGWTSHLPDLSSFNNNGLIVRTSDMWGFCESQETVGVSPEMFGEFILPYQLPILERFGLNCYGCCEPIDPRWEWVKKIPRLRRVSASPWADKRRMRELLGTDYIISVKPNPSFLSGSMIDEESARADVRKSLEECRGGTVELIMKDNHTLGGNPENAVRWVEIAREEIDRLLR